ncbi:DUF192 domain-containing protein [Halospeciosus flavus]|uniref:DUF192 domain-containing protein n=1 Tax=Halospeciosus flavus TaxID=3032283 RepID=A0ABD5Z616_9EURY|nr:DUF192 domain-containing protein [Halospeciosus flavus]
MELRHDDGETVRTLASDVETADTYLARAKGLMFRRSIPDDYALAFRFSGVRRRDVHMLFVPFDIDAVWVAEGEVQRVKRLSAWTGHGGAPADLLVELPAGAANPVRPGDRLWLAE